MEAEPVTLASTFTPVPSNFPIFSLVKVNSFGVLVPSEVIIFLTLVTTTP